MRQPFMLDEVVKNTEVVHDVVVRNIEHFSGQLFCQLETVLLTYTNFFLSQ